MVFFCCVLAFFWIDYRIIESIGHLSFFKKRDLYDGDSEKKWGMFFFSCFFFVGVKEKRNIYFTQKKEEKKSGHWDLISFSHRLSFIRFTNVYTNTFMLKSRLYNTWVSMHFCFSITVIFSYLPIFDITSIIIGCFSITVVVAIFDIWSILPMCHTHFYVKISTL